ncbi:nucleotide-diphosphate-sugar epimerase [Pilimelia terevasa]|uniref:Nucleotide-diphosphate-sugar epimerase n=1 Tax=Pilimelia terevasa TaxID=53372 RepID=A0A8J3BML8_9ACTN|nr:NAD(P)H-binding protein [Pilimelia terevasa]GGK25349.1 nucleotide-diphosphate-sugar epimerase [Pilimelia terevasa]
MTVLVTGATGSVGRLVVDALRALGAPVRALTRDPAAAALPPEVEVLRGRVTEPATLGRALSGVDAMYLAPQSATAAATVAAARAAGVRHVVDLSGEPGSEWHPVARAVEAGGGSWTHLWPGEFIENVAMWAPQLRGGDTVRDAHPEAVNSPVAMADIAAVAARVLTEPGHAGRSLLLTGPAALSRRDRLRELAGALGRPLEYREVAPAEAAEVLRPVMGPYAGWYVATVGSLVAHPQPVSPVLGTLVPAPTTLADWARAHAAVFARAPASAR